MWRTGVHNAFSKVFLKNVSATTFRSVKTKAIKPGNYLKSRTATYKVVDFCGHGYFCVVAKCVDLHTDHTVAVKIHTNTNDILFRKEVEMLGMVSALEPDRHNIVRLIETFRSRNFSCLAFEMLDRTLGDHIRWQNRTLSLSEIRPVIQQLLVALNALKSKGIIHTDLKLDNIMLVDHQTRPFRIKLIDFGLALPVSKAKVGMYMQTLPYRAPEVVLGLPLSEAVDMWGVGCVMANMFFGKNLFSGRSVYDWLCDVVRLLGRPTDRQLDAASYASSYFTKNKGDGEWRLRTPEEYKDATGITWEQKSREQVDNLEGEVNWWSGVDLNEDKTAFLDLLRRCLHLDAKKRISSMEALSHPFITMDHLDDRMKDYTDTAHRYMSSAAVAKFQ